jgi:2'-5' RNA ligase
MSQKRLFFALWPDHRQRDQLRNVISPVTRLIEGDHVYRGDWHVTLVFVGDFPEERIPALLEASRAARIEPFRLRFDRAEYWPRPRVGVLAAQTVPAALQQLVADLNVVVEDAGVGPEDRVYRPHITIARRARPFETQRLAQPADVAWSDFRLVESVREAGRSTYRPVDQ